MVVESDLSIMKPTRLSSLALGGLCLLVSGCASKPIPTVEVDAAKLELFKPLPAIILNELKKKNLAQDLNQDPQSRGVLGKLESVDVRDGKVVIRSKPSGASTSPTP